MKKLNNVVFDPERVVWLHYDADELKVRVHFEDGSDLYFEKDEAVEIWKMFDDDAGYNDS